MGIEHRWNERHTTDHSVLIKARLHGTCQVRIRDVSSSGLFVELPPATPLANNTHAELIFVQSAKKFAQILRIPALVVRTTQTGAGLMFLDAGLMAFRTLLAQLLAEKNQTVQPSGALLEQVYLNTLQRLANTMAQATHNADAGLSASLPDGLHPHPRSPESGPR